MKPMATERFGLDEGAARGRAAPLPHSGLLRIRLVLTCLTLSALFPAACFGQSGFTLSGPGQIVLPAISVQPHAQTVFSGDYTLDLRNNNMRDGWLLTCEVVEQVLQGAFLGQTIGAELFFKSITFISGPSGSTAGISISPDGKSIQAAPNFGRGRFNITFEARADIPPFPAADQYYGIASFTVQ